MDFTHLLARILFAQFLPRGMALANSMILASCIERSEGGVVPVRVPRGVVPVTVEPTVVSTVVSVTASDQGRPCLQKPIENILYQM